MLPKCATNSSRRALPWTLNSCGRIYGNRFRIISSANVSAVAAAVTGNEISTTVDEMIVRVPTNSYPIERIMKAWSEEESDQANNSFANILAWTKTFQETSLSSSSLSNKRFLGAAAEEELSRTNSRSTSSDVSTILSMLDSSSLILPKETLTFLLRHVAQHSQNIRKTGAKRDEKLPLKLKELEHVSSAILLRLVVTDTTTKVADGNLDVEEAGLMIGAWNAWIQCLVDDDPNEYPVNGQKGMPASTMAQNVFHLMTGNVSFFNDIIAEERKFSSANVDAFGTDVRNLPKYQLYHYLLKNFLQDDLSNNTRLLQPNIETFNAVMDHVSRAQRSEVIQWTSAKQLFHWIVGHPTVSFDSHIQILRTYQILFQSMPWSTTLKTKKSYLVQLNNMIAALNAKNSEASPIESTQNLLQNNPYDLIQLFNACMKHCRYVRSFKCSAIKFSVLPLNPSYRLEHPCSKSWITYNATPKNRKLKKCMDDAQHTEDWLQFMIDNHLHHSQASQQDSTAESYAALHKQEDAELVEGIFMTPPPNVTSYECVIQGWVRTGTLFGLLRAQEWFVKLCREHVRNIEASKSKEYRQPTNWCKPSISTLFPILDAWAWADFDQSQLGDEEIENSVSLPNYKGMASDEKSESDQNSSQKKETMTMIIPIVIEDWIFQLVKSSNSHSKSQELSLSLDYPDILVLTSPIVAWRNFIRKHYLTRHHSSSSSVNNDVLWATKRCLEWMHTIESLVQKGHKADNKGNELINYVILRSAYTYTMDAIAFMILHSSGEEREVEDEGVQHLFEVMDSLNTHFTHDASSTAQSIYLPSLYGQCVLHFRQILQKLQKTRHDVDHMNHIEHEFMCRIEKMLHKVPFEKRGNLLSEEDVNSFNKAKPHSVKALEDILLKPTWTVGHPNDYRLDKEPIAPHPLVNAHHFLYREIMKYIKYSGCAQVPRQQGHAIRILMNIMDRLTTGPSDKSIDKFPVDSTVDLFQEIIPCIGMVVVHRAERAEILERVYKQILSLSSVASVNFDRESLQNAIMKAMGGNHHDTYDLKIRLQGLK